MENKNQMEVNESKLYMMAADEIMPQISNFTNKNFNPKDKDECIDTLKAIVKKKDLSIDWIITVATANYNNKNTFIDYGNDEKWTYLGGGSKATQTRNEFINQVKDTLKAIKEDGIKGYHKSVNKSQWGKKYTK